MLNSKSIVNTLTVIIPYPASSGIMIYDAKKTTIRTSMGLSVRKTDIQTQQPNMGNLAIAMLAAQYNPVFDQGCNPWCQTS